MKCVYALLIGLLIGTSTSAQIFKKENDTKTGLQIRSAVTVLASGMGRQLNFFSRGNEKLIEFVDGFTLEIPPAKILKSTVLHIKLKNDSVYHFKTDSSRYTVLDDHGFQRISFVAVVQNSQLKPLLDSQVKAISLSADSKNELNVPPISDNNRREIKRAVAYIMEDNK